ncbi:flagellar basal body L-ring protein FlgH [Dyella sp.]|uniref:flagellar basal body L-ring protein FlgH n=1 Tax=Dyella sp. TaxID=1869338 RepID=UPI002FDA2D15
MAILHHTGGRFVSPTRRASTRAAPILLVIALACSSTLIHAADLYQRDDHRALIADRRATTPGDIVTILVYENSSASSSADTSTNTSAGIKANVTALPNTRDSAQLGVGDNYGGRGQIQRTGRLLAQISATVTEIFPNGDLNIAGQQMIDVNGEKTKIKLSGRVRSVDIAQNNTVQSNRLADAKIEYVGDGFITDRTRPGLIPRFLAWLGLW